MKMLLIALVIASLTACGKKVVEPNNVVVTPTVDQMLVAVIRDNPASTKVCFESENQLFLIQYPKTDDENVMSGWYALNKYPRFYHAANDTWWINSVPTTEYNQISIDVTNLPCKDTTSVIIP